MADKRDYMQFPVLDRLVPLFRRPLEDIVYEVLDRRQVPDRADLREIDARIGTVSAEIDGLRARFAALERGLADADPGERGD